ncbi:MAG: DEAD/DEAH box helicase [Alphaproteobacteria bacterium]|nr:DEAD/DEAH box helicase [Alphaproteobacteria bacterium]
MSALTDLFETFRQTAASEREKGTYFERFVKAYLQNEPYYADLYAKRVWLWKEWRAEAAKRGLGDVGSDAGIDLAAETTTGELHAIQAKFYDQDARLTLTDLSTFLTASGKKQFAHGLIFLTATKSTGHLRDALQGQKTPISLVTLFDLENSQIDWSKYRLDTPVVLKPKKTLLPHQQTALKAVEAGLQEANRGKLIMACGTGKTFIALKIAEDVAGKGGRVLFLMPSLALLSQALTEWTQESAIPLHSFAVCSDTKVGKHRRSEDDDFEMLSHELQYPATTEAKSLAAEMAKRFDIGHMSAVFSTYQSIDVISEAQKQYGLPEFDLIVCDEAHRTTGATFEGEDESHFVKVHDANFIKSKKRLYMTATPRIYGEHAKATAEKDNVTLASMDDVALYGKMLYVLTFSEAVKRGLLSDYKVIVLAVEETLINRRLQRLLALGDNDLKVDDAARIVGCWKALSKQGLTQDLHDDGHPMQRAVAFCHVIEAKNGAKVHKVGSKNIARMFQAVVEAYQESAETEEETAATLKCEAEHVDGTMNAADKEAKLAWLKAISPEATCRILSNVRCLSEGVDVPALDAVLFLTPRNSQVDVVQAVGRVMRKAPGKQLGYIILPIVIPAGKEPHEALNDNVTYKVVWQVLQALRSHDDRFDAMVNKLDLIGKDTTKMEVVAVTEKIQRRAANLRATESKKRAAQARDSHAIGQAVADEPHEQAEIEFEIGEIEKAIYAKLVQKVGNRHHWEDWANDIAKIANTHIDRIKAILGNPENKKERKAFDAFAAELRDDLNDEITDAEIIEMLAQHLVTQPVFEALFDHYDFAKQNPMSRAMQKVLDTLEQHHLGKEADTLTAFYQSVKLRAEGITSADGKQKIIKELYDKFFNGAFPQLSKRLGIVYTPVEVVDFIIRSVQDVLRDEFGTSLGNRNVHILDPFTGTGTFITRLLQSGFISKDQLAYKYKNEIHANELVLLAYYIASINIETAYHDLMHLPGAEQKADVGTYTPFPGICLTDTFQMYEKDDLVNALLVDNSARRKRQKKLDIRVIMANPPYSVGQESANDNNQNVDYPTLDNRIDSTYGAKSSAKLKKSLHDSYIRAIRWASDRIGASGVVGYVTNAGFVDANASDGLRQCLAAEFSNIYVFHLRGNQRTSGETSRREGGKIFGGGSRAPIAISLLVKNPKAKQYGQIQLHNIGDYLSREEKLATVATFGSIDGITKAGGWQPITPDAHGDWLRQRNDSFSLFMPIGDGKRDGESAIFSIFSNGVKTNRDAWCYNTSKQAVASNMERMITFYNTEVARFNAVYGALDKKDRAAKADRFIDTDTTRISWSGDLVQELVKDRGAEFDESKLRRCLYRPFFKEWLYFDRQLNNSVYQMPRLFPDIDSDNLVIVTSGVGALHEFTSLITNVVADLCVGDIRVSQYFPLYLYDEAAQGDSEAPQSGLFEQPAAPAARKRRDAITDAGLAHFTDTYPGEKITKKDLFYYIYGLLHSPDYRERYADNLAKELARIPRVKTAADFWAFSKAGRALADLHLNYETAAACTSVTVTGPNGKVLTVTSKGIAPGKPADEAATFRVEKMKVPKSGKDKDLTRLIYNAHITITGIPPEAYDYVVNGKPALDWVIERQCVKTDKASGIVNDANAWAIETMENPRYPLELFLRVITVSLETVKIVRTLPKLDILEGTSLETRAASNPIRKLGA